MKQIVKGQINKVVVTLYEKTTLSPVYYLFEFIPKGTKVPTYCIASEDSTQLQRYNRFLITETDAPNPLNGEVSLPPGEAYYNVYQQSSSTNLDPAGLTIVESKLTFVIKSSTPAVQYSGAETTNIEYTA